MPRVVGDVLATGRTAARSGVDAVRIYPAYLAAVEQLWQFHRRLENDSEHAFGRMRGSSLACALIAAACRRRVSLRAGAIIPELTAPVNDFAGVIDAASKQQLDALCASCRTRPAT